MKKYKFLSSLFLTLALLFSHTACIVGAYGYCDYLYGIEYKGYSAPAYVGLFPAAPLLFAAVCSFVVSVIFYKKWKKA